MKIAYFLGEFPKRSNTFIHNEIVELKRRGFEIVLYSMNLPDNPAGYGSSDYIVSYICYVKNETYLSMVLSAHVFLFFTSFRAYCFLFMEALTGKIDWKIFVKYTWVARHLISHDVDMIYAHFAESQAIVARIASLLTKKKYTLKIHGSDILMSGLSHRQLQPLLRDATLLLVVSKHISDYISTHFSLPLNAIYIHTCGIDLSFFAGQPFVTDSRTVVFVGRQIENKGVRYLIESAVLLQKRNVDFKMVIIGDGPQLDGNRSLCQSLGLEGRVEFLGALENKHIVRHLVSARCLVLPSLCEGAPMVIMEAMACGLPVVASRVGGIPDMISDGENGYLVEPKDISMLADKIEKLIGDQSLACRLGKNGRRRAKNYDLGAQTTKLIKLWESI